MSRNFQIALFGLILVASCATEDDDEAYENVPRVDFTSDPGGGGGGGGCPMLQRPPELEVTTPDCRQARLAWTAPPIPCPSAFVGYNVYRCTTSTCSARVQLGVTQTALTAVDTGPLAQNANLYYGVTAIDIWGRESDRQIRPVKTPACTGTGGSYVRGLGNTNVTEMQDTVTVTEAGNNFTYVLSNVTTPTPPADLSYAVTKYDSVNAIVWQRSFGGVNGGTAKGSALSANGSVVMVTGRFQGSVDFDLDPGNPAISPTSKDVFLQKLDATNGIPLGWRAWGSLDGPGSEADEGTGVDLTNDGHVLLAARAGCAINFSGGQAGAELPKPDEEISEPLQATTPNPVGYIVKLDVEQLSTECGGCWTSALRVGKCNSNTTDVTIRDVAFFPGPAGAAGKIAAVGSFTGEINMDQEPVLSTTGGSSDMFATVFSDTDWTGAERWISQFGHPSKEENARAVTFDTVGQNVFLTGDIKGNCTGGICTAFEFKPCHGQQCPGTGTNLLSNPATTIFLAKLSVTPNPSNPDDPTVRFATSFPNLDNPATAADSRGFGIVASPTRITIGGEVGGPGIRFGGNTSLTPGSATAFIAAFETNQPVVQWSRAAAGTGATNRLGLAGSNPTLAGKYTSAFHWNNKNYPGTSGGFTATFSP